MAAQTTRQGILVATDGSTCADAAVRWAAQEAAMRHADLTVVNVSPALPPGWAGMGLSMDPDPEDFSRWQEQQGRQIVDDARVIGAAAAPGHPPDVSGEVFVGALVPTLVDLTKTVQMMVVGSRGQSAARRVLLGSVGTALVHHAHRPVAVIHDHQPPATPPAHAPVLVGVDGSPASELATAIAFDEASWRHAELVALHACSDTDMSAYPGVDRAAVQTAAEEVLAERLAGCQERYPDVTVRRVVVLDKPARLLLAESQSAQLVVVGSRGRGGFTGMLLGSVSSVVVQAARIPVIVARGY